MRRRLLIACLALVAIVGIVVRLTVSDSSQPTTALGVYAGAGDPQGVSDFASLIGGGQPTYAMDFESGQSWQSIANPTWWAAEWQGSPYKLIWGVPMLPGTFSANPDPSVVKGSCYGLTQEAKSTYNGYFESAARILVKYGDGSSIIRIGWEFNGNWAPWSASGCASAFVGAFRQIVDAFRTVPGAHFTFEWNPEIGDSGIGNLGTSYYPGNSYVDYVGEDVYDETWNTYAGAAATFQQQKTEAFGLDWLVSFAAHKDKPVVLPEWGLGEGDCSASGQPITVGNNEGCGGDDAAWINLMAGWMKANGVFEATYWDFDTPGSVDHGNDPLTAAALVADFGGASPRATHSGIPPATTTSGDRGSVGELGG